MGLPINQVISHWQHVFANFNISSNEFYSKIESVLNPQQMPHTKVERTNLKEGGIFSSSREYLRVKYKKLVFDICAAPFGTNFFISWWFYEIDGTLTNLLKSTKAGDYLANRASKKTFYEIDEESIFKESVHACVLQVVESIMETKGKRLTDAEMKILPGGIA